MFSGCATMSGSSNTTALKQAFGDAVRSLEGVGIASIPAVVNALKVQAGQWLPQSKPFIGPGLSVVGGAIKAFVAANPQTPADINSALEAVATTLQTTP